MRMEVDGLAPFINRLEKFDKDISKALKKEMRAASATVSSNAKKRISGNPLSNWGSWRSGSRDLSFAPSEVRRGFSVATNRYRRSGATVAFGYDVVQKSTAGSIFETVGKLSGSTFVDQIVNRRGGTRPRTLIPAYYAEMDQAQARIEEAVRNAEREVGL
jgi:hypothetical protein